MICKQWLRLGSPTAFARFDNIYFLTCARAVGQTHRAQYGICQQITEIKFQCTRHVNNSSCRPEPLCPGSIARRAVMSAQTVKLHTLWIGHPHAARNMICYFVCRHYRGNVQCSHVAPQKWSFVYRWIIKWIDRRMIILLNMTTMYFIIWKPIVMNA